MRILIMSNWFPPITSGSSYYTSSMAHALHERGNEVVVVTLDWGPDHAPDQDLPFDVHSFPVRRIPKLPFFYNLALMGFAWNRGNRKRLRALVDEFRPDVLHHVNHIFDTTFLTVGAARAKSIPIVGSITTPIQNQSRLKQRLMRFADRWTVGRFGVCRWDGIISLDRTIHDYVGEVYGEQTQRKSVVIPFGVRHDQLSVYQAELARSERPQILFVGHIHPFRNPIRLVSAMPSILERVPDARLVLCGRVDLQEPVKEARRLGLGESVVKFMGATEHTEIVKLMKQSHCFASWVTGPYHSLGTAPMEAMLCRTPVVNDLPEDLFGDETLRHDKNIILVDSHDPESIADGIVPLLQDDDLRMRIGEGGRDFVSTVLEWDRVAAQMEQLYMRVSKATESPELTAP